VTRGISWKVAIWPLLLVAIVVGGWMLPWDAWVPTLRDWVDTWGYAGAAVFVGLYVLVVILPLPAAAMAVLGGLAFGWWGVPLSLLGSVLGAVPPFLIARRWLRGPVLRRFPGPRVAAADRAVRDNAVVFVTLLRLTPVLPFTAQNWLLGLTEVRLWPYLWTTTLGLAPGTVATVWLGIVGGLAAGAAEGPLWLMAAGLAAFGAVVVWLSVVATRELRRAGFGAAG
jgi:uncharacterized membrane protein YdjX (TVP38/TMEM64 family)